MSARSLSQTIAIMIEQMRSVMQDILKCEGFLMSLQIEVIEI